MNRCPITYQPCGDKKYSEQGLRKLSPQLKNLVDFPYSAAEQLQEAARRADKMSIQGVQPKLSARLSIRNEMFRVVSTGGHYILKPPNPLFQEIPENEDLTMRLAELAGISVPLHGLVYSKDGSLTYFIKRFDRKGAKGKIPVEDFAQLTGETRDTKYNSSMEKVAAVLDRFCTFPAVEKVKLFRLTIFNFLVGNEDMHLKNFTLITRGPKVELSPAYDLVNTTIALRNPQEELALSLRGKKSRFKAEDFLEYYALERLGLNEKIIANIWDDFIDAFPRWENLVQNSFLSGEMKLAYLDLLGRRKAVLHF